MEEEGRRAKIGMRGAQRVGKMKKTLRKERVITFSKANMGMGVGGAATDVED